MSDRPDDDPMGDEFSTLPRWTADAVAALGADHAVPAACRGSGTPDALRWLARACGLRPGDRLLDSGAGEGGPAELAAREFGVAPLLAEPMLGACLAARRMFGRPTVVADGRSLPVRDACVDAAWSIGVLCTVEDKAAQVSELRRVVRDDGSVALLVFVRSGPLPRQPEGNFFPDRQELAGLLDDAGLQVVAEASLDDFEEPSADWQQAVQAVDAWIAERHGDDERYRSALEQQRVIGGLLDDGLLSGLLAVARPVLT